MSTSEGPTAVNSPARPRSVASMPPAKGPVRRAVDNVVWLAIDQWFLIGIGVLILIASQVSNTVHLDPVYFNTHAGPGAYEPAAHEDDGDQLPLSDHHLRHHRLHTPVRVSNVIMLF
jgi:hypothetical protein